MKRLTLLLLIFSLGAILIVIAPVFVFGFKVIGNTGLCPNDFMDILLWAPFMAVMFLLISKEVVESGGKAGVPSLVVLVLFGMILFEGHGIHFGANAIHNIQDGGEEAGKLLSDVIYFYDESLGHWLYDIGFFGLLGTLFVMELKSTDGEKIVGGELSVLLVSALLFGFYAASSALEGQTAYEVLVYFVLLIVISGIVSLKGVRKIMTKRLTLFLCSAGVVIIVAYTIYYIIFGGLIEPSEWM
ncbi:MAG: hypothetical protein JW984_01305 [Deltaproteobacteria bacterium]|uniref:Uncharacterized protein n=1 Tax=Candidatus Zymogenus saltonus TaxID=2844893 RepID=A0A9D8KDX6_9DELT|nr:hypothetical protein [Candidatus Zymogenus saltonus]